MSDEAVNEILDGLNVPTKAAPPDEKPKRTVNKPRRDDEGDSKSDEKQGAIQRLTEMSKIARVTVKPGTEIYNTLTYLLPLMAIDMFDIKKTPYTLRTLPPPPKDGVFSKFGFTYDSNDKNFYITKPKQLTQIDRIANKNNTSFIVDKFATLNTEKGHAKPSLRKSSEMLAELLNEYFGGKTSIGGNTNGNLKNLPYDKTRGTDYDVAVLTSLLLNGEEYNPYSEVEPVIETPKPQPNAEEPQPNAEEPQVVPADSGAIAKPDGDSVGSSAKADNRIVINPQALNDLQTNQAQQLSATEAINTELLNTKHQLEQQQKILEEQNEILRAKDEFEKKLFQKKEIVRYIEGEGNFTFDELVNTVDDALSSKDKRADDFLIASAVQSILNKRDALEKLRDNERRKKSSQWSKAKIKDIHVEVQRDNNISPLMARSIASIS